MSTSATYVCGVTKGKSRKRITPRKATKVVSNQDNLLSDSLCDTFNDIGATCDVSVTKKLDSLKINVPYLIVKARCVETKFGKKIVVDLKDGFSVFLPSRFTCMDDESVDKLSSGNYSLIYQGLQKFHCDMSFHKVLLQVNNNCA